jgi:hypothetical protein
LSWSSLLAIHDVSTLVLETSSRWTSSPHQESSLPPSVHCPKRTRHVQEQGEHFGWA